MSTYRAPSMITMTASNPIEGPYKVCKGCFMVVTPTGICYC